MAIRARWIERHDSTDGSVIRPTPDKSRADGYLAGDDMKATIAGSPDTVAAKVQQLADIGINHLHLRFLGEWDGETRPICKTSTELYAREIMPRFNDNSSREAPPLNSIHELCIDDF